MSQKLVLKDIQNSSLSGRDMASMGLTFLTRRETEALTGRAVKAYKIPYPNGDGKPSKNGFYRIKFLEPVHGEKDKPIKYWQKAGSPVHLYFPPIASMNWAKIKKDVDNRIYITEGEKKAACGCKHGMYTVGLGGVWSFKSVRLKQSLIPDFDEIVWSSKRDGELVSRHVTIVFDNDVHENVQVLHALQALASELTARGAIVTTIKLPASAKKYGMDDYIHEFGIEAFEELEEEGFLENEILWNLNEELAYVKSVSRFCRLEDYTLHTASRLVDTAFADRHYVQYINDKARKVNAAKAWIEWPCRRTHNKLTYEPGKDVVCNNNELNVWRPSGVIPAAGDIGPWITLMDYIFEDNHDDRKWFEQWLAYPLQHPGVKLATAVVLHGREQGTGKTIVGCTMRKIYGYDNSSIVSQGAIFKEFNAWAKYKQFVMGEEISGTNKRADADRLKMLITQETMMIEPKGVDAYPIKDCINYLFTSQHADSIYIESEQDRRYFIWEMDKKPLPHKFYTEIYDKWKGDTDDEHSVGPGIPALYHYLLNLDLTGFHPKAPARKTSAKLEMMTMGYSDMESFLHDLIQQDDCHDLWEIKTLRELYKTDRDTMNTPSSKAISNALLKLGCKKVPLTRIPGVNGAKNLWAVKNVDKWRKSTPTARVKQWLKQEDKTKKKY